MDLRDPQLYINRDISWLKFNERVLQEAKDPRNPLLERVKYLGIFANNLDEFFEVRISGLLQQLEAGVGEHGPDGMLPEEQLVALSEETHRLVDIQYDCWNDELLPALYQSDVHIRTLDSLNGQKRTFLQDYCQRELHPVLTPITVNPAHPYPRLINKALCIAVLLRSHDNETLFGLVQVPRLLPRLIRLPKEDESRRVDYVFLADLVQQHIPELFRGYHILDTAAFRITRNSDLYLDEEEADDLLLAIQGELKNRRKGDTVRLEVDVDASSQIVSRLQKNYNLKDWQIYFAKGPVNLNRVMMLYNDTPRPDLKYQSYQPIEPLQESYSAYFANIRENDIFLHHPYDSFQPVIQFVNAAAVDPKVLAIKQTLYRTTDDSPIINALINAADIGKEVTVVVELKARFDEESNIQWARQLQDAGVCVVYGVGGFKTHCKLSLLIRRETDGIRRYAHIGTGNYNPDTARLYTDVGLITARPDITADVAEVFNLLTTQSSHPVVGKVLVAPFTMMDSLLAKIERESEHARAGRPARIVSKMNSLQDDKIIHALYLASQSGVEIDLIVRGICCLRPGVPGVSETIRVRSIVGRYLEHSRIYSFENGGHPEVYIGSADWMPRNLRRRVELLCPIEDPNLLKRIRSEILSVCLADNISARELASDGTDRRLSPTNGNAQLRAQWALMARAQGETVEIPDFFAQAPTSTPASPSSSNGSPSNQPSPVRNQKET